MKWFKRWLLKRFKIELNFPMERAKIRLTPKLRLLVKGDGKPIYLKNGECGIYDKVSGCCLGCTATNPGKFKIIVRGKRCIVRNFTFIGETPEAFIVE